MKPEPQTRRTQQRDIHEVVWNACDTFRGTIDPSMYKDYILVLLFVKYVSDLVRERREHYGRRYEGNRPRIERAMARERFVVPAVADFETLHASRFEPDIGERINLGLEALEEVNRAKLDGVFRSADFNSETALGETLDRNVKLRHLLEDFADPRLDLRPGRLDTQDVLGDAYEFLVKNFASGAGKRGGEFYTPPEVSRLLARLMEPKPGDRICDPCCGSGSLLIRTAECIAADPEAGRNVALYGQELNGSTWALCKMNMVLHGFDQARIERGDTLRSPKLLCDGRLLEFDIVVANPPFSLDKWGLDVAERDPHHRFERGLPPRSRGDYAFLSHMIKTLAMPQGRMGVVVPHGVLFRGGREGVLRRRLLEENLIDGVIGLPANLFYGVGIPAALLLMRCQKPDDSVFLIDASGEGNYEKDRNQNRLKPEKIDRILDTWRQREPVERFATVVGPRDLAANDHSLNLPLYVDTYEPRPPVSLEQVRSEIEVLESRVQRARADVDRALADLGL